MVQSIALVLLQALCHEYGGCMKKLCLTITVIAIMLFDKPVQAYSRINWSLNNAQVIAYVNNNMLVVNSDSNTDYISYADGSSVWKNNSNELKTELDKICKNNYLDNSQYRIYNKYLLLYIDSFKCYNIDTGKLLWSNDLLTSYLNPELFLDNYAYLGKKALPMNNGKQAQICKINMETGKYEFMDINGLIIDNNSIIVPLFLSKDRIYFAYEQGMACYSITGQSIVWKSKIILAYPRGLSKKYLLKGKTLVVISTDVEANIYKYYIVAVDTTNGLELWRKEVWNYVVKNNNVICLTNNNNVHNLSIYDLLNGNLLKTINLPHLSSSFFDDNMQIFNNSIYILSYSNKAGLMIVNLLSCNVSNNIILQNSDVTSFNVNNLSVCLSTTQKIDLKTNERKVLSISIYENNDLLRLILGAIFRLIIP